MKKFQVVILSLLMLVGMFPDTCDYIFFKLNQVSISETLCLQKEKKSNTCKGKCYLKKMMTENQDQELPYTPQEKENKNLTVYCLEVEKVAFPLLSRKVKKATIYATSTLIDRFSMDRLLRPPDYS